MLKAINQHQQMKLPSHYPKKWVVDCRKVGYGEQAYQYLSRYLYRGVTCIQIRGANNAA